MSRDVAARQEKGVRMGGVASAFTAADGSRKKAFIPFVTCGDPSIGLTEQVVRAMERAGADLIELGIPFSDPTAEGPTIREANVRALKNHVTTDEVIDMVARLRSGGLGVPLVFMTYANMLFSYGLKRFAKRAAEAGVDGVVLPDVPHEEKQEFMGPLGAEGLDLVSLVAPTSHDRIKEIASDAQGFVYVVSSLGVTGVRSKIVTDIPAMVRLVREANPTIPTAVGFGISTPEQAAALAGESDGAIVGSAIVRLLAQHGADAVPYVEDYVREMAKATHGA